MKSSHIGFCIHGRARENKVEEMVSAESPDWSCEKPRRFWDPSRKLLLVIRRYQYWRGRGGILSTCLCKWLVLSHRFWSIVTGADIPLNCRIGGGLLIPHPNGIVIHPHAEIGVNCLIFQQVTIGTRDRAGVPAIAGHVDIGAGAKILGPVRVPTCGRHVLKLFQTLRRLLPKTLTPSFHRHLKTRFSILRHFAKAPIRRLAQQPFGHRYLPILHFYLT